MKTIHIEASEPYNVIIGNGILDKSGEIISKVLKSKRTVIVSDDNVYPYLRLGAGAGSNDTTFWLKKYTDYWWMGNVAGNTGIKINKDKTVEIVGTAKIYATLA